MAENPEIYEIANESENLADFQINNKLTKQRYFRVLNQLKSFLLSFKLIKSCLVFIERRNQRFRNTGQLMNSVNFRIQSILSKINSQNSDKTCLWHIKQKTNVPLNFDVNIIEKVLNSDKIYNETFF